ncbi:suppressor of fused domain protein [Staphylococcus chromogenes]|nr:suppressor of fused domain protein [Staphylococcus chromogenes]
MRHSSEFVPEHIGQFLSGDCTVFHELIPDALHIDVYVWAPTEQRPVWTLVTAGMSEYAMTMPAGLEGANRCELVMTLPADWDVANIQKTPELFWPMYVLKSTARLPHDLDTWLSFGTSLQAEEDPAAPYEGSTFSGLVVGPAVTLDNGSTDSIRATNGDSFVHFWGLYPLLPSEVSAAIAEGGQPVLEKLLEAGIYEGVHPGRPAVI